MDTNFKKINIGKLICLRMKECGIKIERAASFLKVSEDEVEDMYLQKSLDSDVLLRWCKLLDYDFFRIYSQHLILYSPQDKRKAKNKSKNTKSQLPVFKKNIYTQEIILYLIDLVDSGKKTIKELQSEYNIPSTTILRWRDKYSKNV